jgi:hypothetical protein
LACALAMLLVALGAAASAWAWRRPNASERPAIVAAAKRTPHAGTSSVHISEIRLSTVGPWASATVTIYFAGEADKAVDILHRVRGAWKNASVGTAGEWCVMPVKDQRNLGFPASYPCH